MAMACHEMIVDEAGGLQERIDGRRSDETKPLGLESFGNHNREIGLRGNVPDCSPRMNERFAIEKLP